MIDSHSISQGAYTFYFDLGGKAKLKFNAAVGSPCYAGQPHIDELHDMSPSIEAFRGLAIGNCRVLGWGDTQLGGGGRGGFGVRGVGESNSVD